MRAGKLRALGIDGRQSATVRCRTCQPSLNWATPIHRPRSGSASSSRRARLQTFFKRLTDAPIAAHADPEIRSKLEAQGYDVVAQTGPQLKTGIKEQTARWGRLVQASGWSVEDRGSTK